MKKIYKCSVCGDACFGQNRQCILHCAKKKWKRKDSQTIQFFNKLKQLYVNSKSSTLTLEKIKFPFLNDFLWLDDSFQYVNRIIFLECCFCGYSSFSLHKNVPEIIFSKCSFEESFKFSRFSKSIISLNDCEILNSMTFIGNDAIKVKIKHSSLKENNCLSFINNNDLAVNAYGVNNIVLDRKEGVIVFNSDKINSIDVGSSQLKVLKIASESCVFQHLKCKDLKAERLNLLNTSFLEDSTVLFEECFVDECFFNRIVNKTRFIQFNSLTVKSQLNWSKFDLRNTYFNDFNLSKCSVLFDKVNFIGAHLNSIEWNENFSKMETSIATITQIKSMYDDQKNFHLADCFYSLEMNQRRIDPNLEFPKKIVSYMNWKISNYGMSYIRPIFILFFSAFIVTVLDMTLQGNFELMVDSNGNFFKVIDIILNILNRCSDFIIPFSHEAFSGDNGKLFRCDQLDGFFSLLYIIWSSIIIWHIIVAVKRINRR